MTRTAPTATYSTRTLTQRILAMHLAEPTLGATIIAHRLGCTDAYVRKVAQRKMLNLPRSQQGAVPSYGAQYVAEKRRARRISKRPFSTLAKIAQALA